MCKMIDSGDACLRDWGQWAARDGTVRRLGYPGCSAEQMANHVPGGGDHEENKVAELVDRLLKGLLEDRKRIVAKLFYVDRLSMGRVAASVGIVICRKVSVDMVKADLNSIRSMVGGVVLCYGHHENSC